MHTPFLPRRQRGFSLPELMIAVTIGLVILAGMATLFVGNSKTQAEVEKANRQVENGRFGIQLLSGSLRNAGFLSEFDPTVLATPAVMPNPCTATLANLVAALPLHVQGYDNVNASTLSCLPDAKPGTDVIVVRHTATCLAGAANCDAADNEGPYFQASLCYNGTELNSGNTANFYALGIQSGGLDRHKKNCTETAGSGTLANYRRLLTHIYYVSNNDEPGDGVPTLKRGELSATGSTLAFASTSQVNGIENMQLEYGIDTNADGVADLYAAIPDTANACALPLCAAENWRNVVAVKVHLLARNLEKTTGHRDTKTYTLGRAADGDLQTTTATNDAYKRHVFQSQIGLPNPAGRKTP